ncbi:MAG TPA: Rieske (2Fe-2S) protein [Jiangellales bacterium]|nr:Rieske (2Fe-2S) protein [Jiangellales bacterium]
MTHLSTPGGPDHDTPTPRALGRRTVLAGVVAVGAGTALAACGSDGGGDAGSGAGGGSGTGSATPSGEATPQPPGGSGEALAAVGDVPVGGGVITAAVVVTQPTEGEFRAFSSVCTHQACVVSSVADGSINCACHGSRFSIEDGSVENGPATAPLPEVAVAVEGTDVVLA